MEPLMNTLAIVPTNTELDGGGLDATPGYAPVGLDGRHRLRFNPDFPPDDETHSLIAHEVLSTSLLQNLTFFRLKRRLNTFLDRTRSRHAPRTPEI
jgi:hypothetical protein